MGKLIYFANCSLDGYVEDETGSFDWTEPEPEVHAFINDAVRGAGTHGKGSRLCLHERDARVRDVRTRLREHRPGGIDAAYRGSEFLGQGRAEPSGSAAQVHNQPDRIGEQWPQRLETEALGLARHGTGRVVALGLVGGVVAHPAVEPLQAVSRVPVWAA